MPRPEIKTYLFETADPEEERRRVEELVERGELVRFEVGDGTEFYFDPHYSRKREAVIALEVLHKLQGYELMHEELGDCEMVELYKRAQERLYEFFPDMTRFEELYQARLQQG